MTKIDSEKVEVNASAQKVFELLSNFNNFQKLMPPQVTNWSSTDSECTFTINGMATIGMKILEKNPHSLIKISSNGKVPFDFFLFVHLEEVGEKCNAQLKFESDLNAMMAMMVEKPLTNFFNLLVKKLQEIYK